MSPLCTSLDPVTDMEVEVVELWVGSDIYHRWEMKKKKKKTHTQKTGEFLGGEAAGAGVGALVVVVGGAVGGMEEE